MPSRKCERLENFKGQDRGAPQPQSPLVGSLEYAFSEVVNHRRASLESRIDDALDEVDLQVEELRAAKG